MSSQARDRAERLARVFHETYERLAPDYGYDTRKESAVPWDEVPEKNRNLMIAVCHELLGKEPDLDLMKPEVLAAIRAEALYRATCTRHITLECTAWMRLAVDADHLHAIKARHDLETRKDHDRQIEEEQDMPQ